MLYPPVLPREAVAPWLLCFALTPLLSCGPTGSQWAQQGAIQTPATEDDPKSFVPRGEEQTPLHSPARRTISIREPKTEPAKPTHPGVPNQLVTVGSHGPLETNVQRGADRGDALGKFRNTFYNFPSQNDHHGSSATVFNAQCRAIAEVPQSFHDKLCVQGSGQLANGQTVSFAKRDCSCARTCPRTNQKICFQALDPKRFPWGRGAMGTAIVPLQTVAVDSALIALGTPLFIPAFVGLPMSLEGSGKHDGCFMAADRGIKVRGKHVDIFAGTEAMTKMYNSLVPSNRGVEVYLNAPRCSDLSP